MAQFVRFLHDAELALVERHLEYAANIQNELQILIRPQIESILYNLHCNQRTESFFITPNLLNVTLNYRYSITACSGTNLFLSDPDLSLFKIHNGILLQYVKKKLMQVRALKHRVQIKIKKTEQ